VRGEDGQSLQHFMSESPWQGQAMFQTIQDEVCQTATLAKGSYLVLDESADEKAGAKSAGVSRQYNGHLGKVDLCQVAVLLGYVNWQSCPWTSWAWLDGELFLPEEWFSPEFAQQRKKFGDSGKFGVQNQVGFGAGDDPTGEKAGRTF
jgi:SRSO17 transposase